MASALSLKPLEIIHKRIVRIITKNLQNTHTLPPLFQKLNLLKLNDIIRIEIVKKMFMYDKNPEVPVHHSLQHIKKLRKPITITLD